jgi:drug/metabolite transporter (DMT)-like permease
MKCLFVLLTVIWGSSYLGNHEVLRLYPPLLAAAVRVVGGLLLMLPFAWRGVRASTLTRGQIVQCAAAGLLFTGVAWALLMWGQQYVQPATASILIATTPLITAAFLSCTKIDVRMHWSQRGGVAVGFLGILCVFLPLMQGAEGVQVIGVVAILGTAICYAIGGGLLHNLTQLAPPHVLFIWHGLASGLFLLGLSALFETWPTVEAMRSMPMVHWAMAYLIVFPTVISAHVFYRLVRAWGSAVTLMVAYSAPLVSLSLDYFVLHTMPSWSVFLGMVLIFIGMAMAHRRRLVLVPTILQQRVQTKERLWQQA